MEIYSVLVTGANRGIGLEFVKQIVNLPKPPRYVFATYRSSETLGNLAEIKDSSKISEVVLVKMDVTKLDDIEAARKIIDLTVGENGLTLLINNAGAGKIKPFPNVSEENLLMHFTINTVGPIRVLQEMLPLLQKAAIRNAAISGMRVSKAAVVNITSLLGSITKTGVEFSGHLVLPGYKISKAALNMSMRVIAANVKDDGILIILMCPGWVKTDLGTDKAEFTTTESISAMLNTLPNLNESHHATYMDRLGNPYPF